jgi:HSP20 family protein
MTKKKETTERSVPVTTEVQPAETVTPTATLTRRRWPMSLFRPFELADWFEQLPSLTWPLFEEGRMGFETMRVEEFVQDDVWVLRAEIPDVDPDRDIEVMVDEGRLTIRAERQQRKETTEADHYRSEFRYGSFHRSMTLPAGAKPESITATYTDGVLEVRLPLEAGPRPTKVAITKT